MEVIMFVVAVGEQDMNQQPLSRLLSIATIAKAMVFADDQPERIFSGQVW